MSSLPLLPIFLFLSSISKTFMSFMLAVSSRTAVSVYVAVFSAPMTASVTAVRSAVHHLVVDSCVPEVCGVSWSVLVRARGRVEECCLLQNILLRGGNIRLILALGGCMLPSFETTDGEDDDFKNQSGEMRD